MGRQASGQDTGAGQGAHLVGAGQGRTLHLIQTYVRKVSESADGSAVVWMASYDGVTGA